MQNSAKVSPAGDAAMRVEENVRQGILPGFFDNMSDALIGLRRLAGENARILATHDAEVYESYYRALE
jgi:hypothetical protein